MSHSRLFVLLVATTLSLSACGTPPAGTGPIPAPTPPPPLDSLSPSTSTPSTPNEWFSHLRSGVVRIQTVTCDGDGIATGSGFLIAPDLVSTVAHVVEDADSVSVRGDGGVVRGTVIGLDSEREVALVRLEPTGRGDRYQGEILSFASESTSPEVGTDIHVLGYPQGQQLSMTSGTVNSLDARIDIGTRALNGLIQHSAVATGGNSGGPVINDQGQVVGLIEAGAVQEGRDSYGEPVYVEQTGIGYAVPATVAARLTSAWQDTPTEVTNPACDTDPSALMTQESVHPEAPVMASVFSRYFGGINAGDYGRSWRLLGAPVRMEYPDLSTFRERHATMMISDAVLEQVSLVDPLTNVAVVRYESQQDAAEGPDGLTCARWHTEYTLRLDSGTWTIDRAKPLDRPQRCAAVPATASSTATPGPTAMASGAP